MNVSLTGGIAPAQQPRPARESNKLLPADRAAHDWYRFVLSFPPHLVRNYVERFDLSEKSVVLDPFCGTGTTLVECKKLGIPSVGVEANPMACFASRVKTDWAANPESLLRHASTVCDAASEQLRRQGIDDLGGLPLFRASQRKPELKGLPDDLDRLLLRNSISPLPLHKTLVLLEALSTVRSSRYEGFEKLALAKSLVTSIGNLHFGPEVGVGPAKQDAAVVPRWMDAVCAIVRDLRELHSKSATPSVVLQGDARGLESLMERRSIDAIITSPPYPNEKDYTRTTRLESVVLGFITSKKELRALKETLVRSNTRGVFKADSDDSHVEKHARIQEIAHAIEKRRINLGKTSGFERLYPRVTKLYFGGMLRHLADLRPVLRRGAQLAYVVGDQASYLRIMIRTGEILADLAKSLGYELIGIDLFRTRLATATREQLREEVVLLRWPG